MNSYEVGSLIAYGVQAVAGVLTLGVAYAAYRKFLNNKLAEQQFEIVAKLIEAFHKGKYRFEQVENNTPGGKGSFSLSIDEKNLFELSAIPKESRKQYKDIPFFLTSEYIVKFDPSPFDALSNPLLPESIANSMLSFRNGFTRSTRSPAQFDTYIVMGSKLPKQEDLPSGFQPSVTVYEVEGGVPQFISLASGVAQSIVDWLKKYGISGLNPAVMQPHSESLFDWPASS